MNLHSVCTYNIVSTFVINIWDHGNFISRKAHENLAVMIKAVNFLWQLQILQICAHATNF